MIFDGFYQAKALREKKKKIHTRQNRMDPICICLHVQFCIQSIVYFSELMQSFKAG